MLCPSLRSGRREDLPPDKAPPRPPPMREGEGGDFEFMPQFDIASFFPQIPFFAGIFLLFYTFLTQSFLPKISQNLKLGKKLSDSFGNTL